MSDTRFRIIFAVYEIWLPTESLVEVILFKQDGSLLWPSLVAYDQFKRIVENDRLLENG
jgi:hypothetical protein